MMYIICFRVGPVIRLYWLSFVPLLSYDQLLTGR